MKHAAILIVHVQYRILALLKGGNEERPKTSSAVNPTVCEPSLHYFQRDLTSSCTSQMSFSLKGRVAQATSKYYHSTELFLELLQSEAITPRQ